MVEFIWRSLAMGIGATAAMDVWALLLHRIYGRALPNWALVGRWFAHIPRGRLFHQDIAAAPPVARELAIGWIAHYVIGIVYAGVLILWAGPAWVQSPTFPPALIVGLVTVGAGWFLLQPGMGAGWAASRLPDPWLIRARNVVTHTVFALGLYVTALLIA